MATRGCIRSWLSPREIQFKVWTWAAENGLFGHHFGEITVTTWFGWFDANAPDATPGLELFCVEQPARVLPNEAPPVIMPLAPVVDQPIRRH